MSAPSATHPEAADSATRPPATQPSATQPSAAQPSRLHRGRPVVGFGDHLLGFSLAVAYVVVLLRTVGNLGYARDEGFYYRAAQSYGGWFEQLFRDPSGALSRGAIDAAWSANHEHPSLVKSLFALSRIFLHDRWHVFEEEGTSLRFPAMCMAGCALWLVYIWGARARSRTTGLGAALALALMPRVFYQSHLDCFDIPIVTMWSATAYAFWQSSRQRGIGWPLVTGLLFGLALETKHNAWFLPFVFVAHTLLAQGGRIVRDLRTERVRLPLALFTSALFGPIIFIGLWPWLWFDTVARIQGYVEYHLHHDYYNIVFLGVTYWKPPMPLAYAWVMTLATVPIVTLVLFAMGLGWALGRRIVPRALGMGWRVHAPHDPAHTEVYWLLCLFICYSPWLSPNTPIFGGTKHWMTAYPFLCLFAGTGLDWVARALRESLAASRGVARPLRRVLEPVALFASVFAAPFAETAHSHPWGLSNYTPLVGGAQGAASLGLNRQFWGFTTGAVTGFLNDHVPAGGSVFVHDTAWDSWELLHRDGRLLPQTQGSWTIPGSTFAVYHFEEHMEGVDYQIWTAYGTSSPVHIGSYDGVPIIFVYARPGASR